MMAKFGLLKNIKLILMMLCSVVGVGFVSGAEIYQFYVRFGHFGYLGVVIFFNLMFLIINKILKDLENDQKCLKMNNYEKKSSKNTTLTKRRIKLILIKLNVILVASAMFAGLFNLIFNLFNENYFFVGIVFVLVIFLVLHIGVKGLEKFDFIVLLLLIIISCVFTKNIISNRSDLNLNNINSFSLKLMIESVIFAVLYVFMNVIQMQPIIAELKPKFNSRERKFIALSFSIVLTLILLLFIVFLKNNSEYFFCDMPFLMFFKTQNKFLFVIFVCGLIMALMSSLLSCLIGVKKDFKRLTKSNLLATGGAMLVCMIFSLIGFSNFVKFVYPAIGIINFVIFVFL